MSFATDAVANLVKSTILPLWQEQKTQQVEQKKASDIALTNTEDYQAKAETKRKALLNQQGFGGGAKTFNQDESLSASKTLFGS